MALTPPFSGGCHCGAVRYEITAKPVASVMCHCSDCQKFSGAAAAAIFAVPRKALKTEGEISTYAKTGDSGKEARMAFCPNCGTRLFGLPDAAPQLATVSASSLDDPAQFEPKANIYTASAQHWAAMDPDIPCFETTPKRPG